jgi:hypothetical protein
MDTQPVTYQLFRTIFIENDASILSTYRTIKSFISERRLRSNIAMIFMVATMIFILAFPTLISAMSGYDFNTESRVEDRDGNFIPFSNFSRVLYVIHDGWRIGQNGSYWITDKARQGMSSGRLYPIPTGAADPVWGSGGCRDYDVPQDEEFHDRGISCPLVASVSECKTDMC